MEPIPGTESRLSGNVEIRVITNIRVFYQHASQTVDLAEVRRSWAENWRRRNGLD